MDFSRVQLPADDRACLEAARAFLAETVTEDVAMQLGWGYDFGVVVTEIERGGPAAKAGMLPGDIIYNANGKDIQELGDLGAIIEKTNPGDVLDLLGWRKGQKMRFKVKMGAR